MTGRERAELYGDCDMTEAEEIAFEESMIAHRLRIKERTGRHSSLDQPPMPVETRAQLEADPEPRRVEEDDEHEEPWTI